MLASSYIGRWLALASVLIGLFYLISYGRPPSEPLVGGLRETSTPTEAAIDAVPVINNDGVVTEISSAQSVPISSAATGSSTSAQSASSTSAESVPTTTSVVFAAVPSELPGYEGPFIADEPGNPRLERSSIAKLTMLYYDNITDDTEAYERAMQSHVTHDEKFGYDHFILRRGLIGGLWTKQAEILHFLLQQLAKPAEDRYDWIFWHDADLVLVNDNVPLELFLPPSGWDHIHFVIANDLSGYNAGVYFMRVHEWSVHFVAASLAYPTFHPDKWLIHDEQTAQDILLRDPEWHNHTIHMPQRWFNAYHNFGPTTDVPPEWKWSNGYAEPGDMIVHFPGTSVWRTRLINEWLAKKAAEPATYSPPLGETGYAANVTRFWEQEAPREREVQSVFWRHYKLLRTVGREEDRERDRTIEELKAQLVGWPEERMKEEIERIKEDWKARKIVALREAEAQAVLEGKVYLNDP